MIVDGGDMAGDGAPPPDGWKLVFRQTAGAWLAPDKWKVLNSDDPHGDNFSLLSKLEEHKSGDKFEFKLAWPGLPEGKQLVWKQSSNPMSERDRVHGFEMLSGSNRRFRGLALSASPKALIDGDQGSGWWIALGGDRYPPGKDTFPGPHPTAVDRVELYVKV